MKVKIVGDTGRPTLWAGRVVDLPFDDAKKLVEDGYAVPVDKRPRSNGDSMRHERRR